MIGCLSSVAVAVWLVEWLDHKTPYLLHAWNPWNISLIVIVALMALGSSETRSYADRLKHHSS